MVKRTLTSTTSPAINTSIKNMTDYSTWTKDQLIARLNQLESSSDTSTQQSSTKKQKKQKELDWSKYHSRFIAIRFAYLGWNYNGLAHQNEVTPLPTVEGTILDALFKAKLIKEPTLESCRFSRCGRTDKGVSAMNQVISLNVRSVLTPEEQADSSNDIKEVRYASILNSLLPADIRITAISLRPLPRFDARFSCLSRHYKYMFLKEQLDIDAMNEAAKLYQGSHDFRNFCKVDGSKQITNYERDIYSAKIIPLGGDNPDMYCFDLKGSAFLWHQVRCMVAILFLVGQGLEPITIVSDLLDTEKYPTKPQYGMANDAPLVLYDCTFPEMEWMSLSDMHALYKSKWSWTLFQGLVYDHQIKSQMAQIMDSIVLSDKTGIDQKRINTGDGVGRIFSKYTPIVDRERGEHFEISNAKWLDRKQKKKEEEADSKEQSEQDQANE
ncbi:tRNA pseudouridine [Spathaspora sp. JA1]|nr:tRNA pseudouridine [Spathaspora sp. JA1]